MNRFDFFCRYDGGGPAEAELSPDGQYVLYADVLKLIETASDFHVMYTDRGQPTGYFGVARFARLTAAINEATGETK